MITEGPKPIGAGLNRNFGSPTAPGEAVEHEIDQFIERRHRDRIRDEGERGEEVAWAASEKRLATSRAEEERAGLVAWYRHLERVFQGRAAECGRTAETYERKTA